MAQAIVPTVVGRSVRAVDVSLLGVCNLCGESLRSGEHPVVRTLRCPSRDEAFTDVVHPACLEKAQALASTIEIPGNIPEAERATVETAAFNRLRLPGLLLTDPRVEFVAQQWTHSPIGIPGRRIDTGGGSLRYEPPQAIRPEIAFVGAVPLDDSAPPAYTVVAPVLNRSDQRACLWRSPATFTFGDFCRHFTFVLSVRLKARRLGTVFAELLRSRAAAAAAARKVQVHGAIDHSGTFWLSHAGLQHQKLNECHLVAKLSPAHSRLKQLYHELITTVRPNTKPTWLEHDWRPISEAIDQAKRQAVQYMHLTAQAIAALDDDEMKSAQVEASANVQVYPVSKLLHVIDGQGQENVVLANNAVYLRDLLQRRDPRVSHNTPARLECWVFSQSKQQPPFMFSVDTRPPEGTVGHSFGMVWAEAVHMPVIYPRDRFAATYHDLKVVEFDRGHERTDVTVRLEVTTIPDAQ